MAIQYGKVKFTFFLRELHYGNFPSDNAVPAQVTLVVLLLVAVLDHSARATDPTELGSKPLFAHAAKRSLLDTTYSANECSSAASNYGASGCTNKDFPKEACCTGLDDSDSCDTSLSSCSSPSVEACCPSGST